MKRAALVCVVEDLDRMGPGLKDACPGVEGGTAPAVQALLRILARSLSPGEAYVECGSWLGKSIIPVAADALPGVAVVAVDNFTHHGSAEEQKALLIRNLDRHGVLDRVRILDMDVHTFWTTTAPTLRIGAVFYDADHSHEATRTAVHAAARLLSPGGVLVVDDWFTGGGGDAVRDGAKEALAAHPELDLVAEVRGGHGPEGTRKPWWWLGIGIIQRREEASA